MVTIALIVMISAILAHHLGLTEAIGNVLMKILKCPRCLTFWTILFTLLVLGCDAFIAMGLSILMAYLSIWIGLPLRMLNELYDKLWQKRK
jgi:hypothetical protein